MDIACPIMARPGVLFGIDCDGYASSPKQALEKYAKKHDLSDTKYLGCELEDVIFDRVYSSKQELNDFWHTEISAGYAFSSRISFDSYQIGFRSWQVREITQASSVSHKYLAAEAQQVRPVIKNLSFFEKRIYVSYTVGTSESDSGSFLKLRRTTGMSEEETAKFLGADIDDVKIWENDGAKAPQTALDEMSELVRDQENTAKNIDVEFALKNLPSTDAQAVVLGWPSLSAYVKIIASAQKRQQSPDRE